MIDVISDFKNGPFCGFLQSQCYPADVYVGHFISEITTYLSNYLWDRTLPEHS